MSAFWISFVFAFVAEMGDKTQLVAFAFSNRYKSTTVLIGLSLASAAVHLFSVLLGQAVGQLIPIVWINLLAGVFFLVFGFWTLRNKGVAEEDDTAQKNNLGPLLTVFATFFLAEIGDKTMFATIALAAQQNNFFAVWLGSSLGMVLAGALAVLVGKIIGKNLPERIVKIAAASVFFSFGTVSVAGACAPSVKQMLSFILNQT